MIFTNYIIADSDRERCSILQKKIDLYRNVSCVGSFSKEVGLLENTWLQRPDVVLIHVGDHRLNAFSALRRIKEVTPEVKVVFYSGQSDYAVDAYEKGADYFLLLPADDIRIAKLVLRYIGTQQKPVNAR